jgi:hypothetical protein
MNRPVPGRDIITSPTNSPDRCPHHDMLGMITCSGEQETALGSALQRSACYGVLPE